MWTPRIHWQGGAILLTASRVKEKMCSFHPWRLSNPQYLLPASLQTTDLGVQSLCAVAVDSLEMSKIRGTCHSRPVHGIQKRICGARWMRYKDQTNHPPLCGRLFYKADGVLPCNMWGLSRLPPLEL